MSGNLDGSINVSAPSCYNVRCGEKPVDGVSAITYAENGDIILYAPRGRVRIMAKDIDLLQMVMVRLLVLLTFILILLLI